MMATGQWWHGALPRVTATTDLVVPWHPRALASWLIQHHAKPGGHPELQLPLDDERMARVWVLLAAPSDARLRRVLADPSGGRTVAQALEHLHRSDVLCDALATGDATTRKNILAVGGQALLQRDDCLAAAVDLVLHNDEDAAVEHVAMLVERAGDRGLKALVTALHGIKDDDRARLRGLLLLLCRCKNNSAAHSLLLDHIDDVDRDSRERALYALGKQPIAAALQTKAAVSLLRVIEGKTDRDTQLLAFDALGRCGKGVTEPQRRKLIAMLEKPPARGTRARVLGCLQMLGAARTIPLPTKQGIATTVYPTTATWLSLADEGAPAAELLLDLLGDYVPGIDNQQVANRLARTAPEVLRAWLLGEPRVQPTALRALRSIEPESGIATEQLLMLLKTARRANNRLVEWLAQRDDVGEGAAQVFAWMATHRDTRANKSWLEFAARYALPTPQMVSLLGPALRRGYYWDLVAAGDRDMLSTSCRKWITEATDEDARARLVGTLCKLGIETGEDVAIVLAALRSDSRNDVLYGLEKAPRLPPEVRAGVEEMLELPDSYTRFLASNVLQVARTGK